MREPMTKIIQDISFLRQKSTLATVEEATILIKDLEEALGKTDNGVGLAAVQIGSPKRVGVIKKREGYQYLINAELEEVQDEIVYCREGCLSLPNVFVDTNRYKQITIRNHRILDGELIPQTECYYFSPDPSEMGNDGLVAIAVQHELDHFEGKLITDRQAQPPQPFVNAGKTGRNDKCPCGSGKKYKKCCLV
jgi:peptide deformylase